ncbi:MAG: ABC transporter substrate-binding protein [Bacteroidota bacterium]|nr:ABC transporter substrate-binding protein [Bacteroidota bacterium]
MKKSLFFILSLAVFYTSCSNSTGEGSETRVAKGDKVYGGTLRINETEQYQTLYPSAITDIGSAHIANQIYEGLVKFNPKDLTIIPSIAEKWEVDAAGTTYTFHLKKGVMFQNNECFPDSKGREVKASDVKYSFELLCTDSKDNDNFSATFKDRLVGANKFFEASKGKPVGSLEGVKIVDDYTVKISLTSPSSSFLYSLASPAASIIAKEACDKYGIDMKVGTGPFMFAEGNNDKVVLKRNDNYYGTDSLGNQLPFLDSIVISFLPSKKQELDNFQNGDLAMVIGLPSESIKDLVATQIADFQNKPPKYVLERSPEMASQYYEFNTTKEPFNNVKVRQAFSYAIDRNRIIEDVLKGEAYGPGVNGISPPSFKGYDITKIQGYDFDPEKAKKLLAEAGYPNGKGFPKVKIELNSGGSKNANVVLEIQKQLLEVLNVNVDFEVVPQKQKLDDAKFARAEIFRAAWIADFPSPENFLWILYGATVPAELTQPSYPNTPRYKSAEFDKLFEEGKSAKSLEESYVSFMKAEQILMNDAPILVLWYDENYRLVKSNVRNLFSNPMRFRDYSQVYLKDVTPQKADEKKEEQKN